jgi:tellurite resistance protein
MLGKLLKKAGNVISDAANTAYSAVDRYTNQDFLEGAVAAAVMIARADGNIDANEIEAAILKLSSQKELKSFQAADIRSKFMSFAEMYGLNATVAESKMIEKIKELDSDSVFTISSIMQSIANVDGISAQEKAVIDRVLTLMNN